MLQFLGVLNMWRAQLWSHLGYLLGDLAHPAERGDAAVPRAVVAPLPVQVHGGLHNRYIYHNVFYQAYHAFYSN